MLAYGQDGLRPMRICRPTAGRPTVRSESTAQSLPGAGYRENAMTNTAATAPLVDLVVSNAWAGIAILLVLGVVFPAIWSRRAGRPEAALAVLRLFGDIAVSLLTAMRAPRRPIGEDRRAVTRRTRAVVREDPPE